MLRSSSPVAVKLRSYQGKPLPQQQEQMNSARSRISGVSELERESERWVYEFKLLQPGGGLLKLQVDAQSGQVLRQKSKNSDANPSR